MHILSKNGRLTNFIFLILYRLSLDLTYLFVLSKNYHYQGFVNRSTFYSFSIGLFFTFTLFLFISGKNQENELKKIILHFLYLIIVVPVFVLYSYLNIHLVYVIMIYISFLLIVIISDKIKTEKINYQQNLKLNIDIVIDFFNKFAIFYYIICLLLLFYFVGYPKLAHFDFTEGYDTRENISIPLIFGYILPISYSVVGPINLAILMKKRKKINIIIWLIIQVIFYLTYPLKNILFVPFVQLITTVLVKKRKLIFYMYFGLFSLVIGSLLVFFIFRDINLIAFISNRTLMYPALIQFNYFDFFSINEKLFLSEGIIGRLFNIPLKYNQLSAFMIGEIYFGGIQHANTAFFADSYANFGYLGMIVYSFLLAIIIRFYNNMSRIMGLAFTWSSIFFVLFILKDGSLLTILSTFGLAFSIFVFFIFSLFADNNTI